MTNENDKKDSAKGATVVDLTTFRRKKEADDEFGRGREPLYASHLTGRVTGSPHLKRPDAPDFGDRLQRIRASLDKINRLMTELKKLSTAEAPQQVAAASSGSKSTLV
jgi:hypothetical protein